MHYQPYKIELKQKLLEAINNGCFVYEIDAEIKANVSDCQTIDLDKQRLFSAVCVKKAPQYEKHVRKENGGSFFAYLVDENVIDEIKNELSKCQIFYNVDEHIKDFDDCCFIYALKQANRLSDDTLNLMRMRINKRYLTQEHLKTLCDEFKLKLIVSNVDDEKESKYKCRKIKNHNEYFIGYKETSVENTFHQGLIKNHWFLNESRTCITSSYLDNI